MKDMKTYCFENSYDRNLQNINETNENVVDQF